MAVVLKFKRAQGAWTCDNLVEPVCLTIAVITANIALVGRRCTLCTASLVGREQV